jgi:hypothetical protein
VRDLSLHILDLIENSARAGASQVGVTVAESRAENSLEIAIEDDGRGFQVAPERALDPFYTTKPGKRTGLGLPLFAATVKQAGGQMSLANLAKGAALRARLQLDHVDRPPLGDLATTLSVVSLTHPYLEVACTLRADGRERRVRTSELAATLPERNRNPMVVAMRLAKRVRRAMRQIGVTA